ncbi:MAG: substrate-binding domain-containing protein [Oscillospiraceae bacterium]
MKKIIAMVLAVVMVLSLTACGASTADTAKLEEILSTLESIQTTLDGMTSGAAAPAEAPAEEAPAEAPAEEAAAEKVTVDFTWNGQKEVWSVLPTTGAEGLVWINDAMGAVMEAQGWTYVKKDAQRDPTAQVQFIEDAIAAGNVGAIMCAAMSVELLQDVVLQALEAGIAVAYLGAEPSAYGVSGCVYTAYEITGMFAVQAAEDWALNSGADIPTTADGKYEIAADTYYDIQDGVYRSRAIIGTIEKSENLVLVSETSSYGQDAYTTAYNNATDVLNAHPDCHLFIAYEPEEAMGAADAIAAYCDVNGLSVADYFVAPCYAEDTTFTGMYEESAADPTANAIKGYSTYGDAPIPFGDDAAAVLGASYDALAAFAEELTPDSPVIIPPVLTGEHLADILLSACGTEGYDFPYGETYYDTITAVNTIGFEQTWSMGDENPAAEYKY